MRATLHSGRANTKGQIYKAKHNDRSFDYESAKHIIAEKIDENIYGDCARADLLQDMIHNVRLTQKEQEDIWYMDFTQTEKLFYKKVFSPWLETQNQKHEKSRHTERIKSMDDIYNNKRFCPDESILQYGNMEETVETELLEDCYQDFLEWHEDKFGQNIRILNYSVHNDEIGEVPHIHERKVFFYKDENGHYMPNQHKALEKYYKLPEGTVKSRFNNLKQQYTAECREKWEQIAREHGLQLETERLPKRNHQEKNEYILEQQEKKIADLEKQSAELEREINKKLAYLNEISFKSEELDERLNAYDERLDRFDNYLDVQFGVLYDLLDKYTGNAKEELKKAITKSQEQLKENANIIKDSVQNIKSEKPVVKKTYPQVLKYKGGSRGRGFYDEQGKYWGDVSKYKEFKNLGITIKDPYDLLNKNK